MELLALDWSAFVRKDGRAMLDAANSRVRSGPDYMILLNAEGNRIIANVASTNLAVEEFYQVQNSLLQLPTLTASGKEHLRI
jgi:hypothetical protein